MSELQPLHNRLDALIANLSPQKRSQLAREVGRELAKSQQQRIARQQNPDGSNYVPRRPPAQGVSQKRIKKGKMLKKIRLNRFMKTVATKDRVSVGFIEGSREAGIAAVHQFGKLSTVIKKRNLKHQYDKRELLGFSEPIKKAVRPPLVENCVYQACEVRQFLFLQQIVVVFCLILKTVQASHLTYQQLSQEESQSQ